MNKFTIKNFVTKMRDAKERKYFFALLGGKFLGVAVCFAAMFAISAYLSSTAPKAHAQGTPPAASTNAPAAVMTNAPATNAPAEASGTNSAPAAAPAAPDVPNPPYVNPINTMWVLITAFLVFFMQAGFMFLEAGFSRTRESINVMLEGVVDTSLCGVLFYLWGFAWMFGHGNGFIGHGDASGHSWYCLQNLPDTCRKEHRRCDPGNLSISVRLRGHMFDDHLGRHGGPHRVLGRSLVQHRSQRLHLTDLRPLGLGSGRLVERHPILESRTVP